LVLLSDSPLPRALHSFPTRRSSDLLWEALEPERLGEPHDGARRGVGAAGELFSGLERGLVEMIDDVLGDVLLGTGEVVKARTDRSEEHTSELQSRGHLVCRLLLEKK